MRKLIIVMSILLYVPFVYASEWSNQDMPSMDHTQSILYSSIWESVLNMKFNLSLENVSNFKKLHVAIHFNAVISRLEYLLNRYSLYENKSLLSDYIMQEKNRIYWQEYAWWPSSEIYMVNHNQIVQLINEFKILKERVSGDLKYELIFSLGRCYSDTTNIGVRDEGIAIKYFNMFSNNKNHALADDALLEKILLMSNLIGNESETLSFTPRDVFNEINLFHEYYPDSPVLYEIDLIKAGIYYNVTHEEIKALNIYINTINKLDNKQRKYALLQIMDSMATRLDAWEIKGAINDIFVKEYPNSFECRQILRKQQKDNSSD